MENISQTEAIRQHLEAGNTITPLEALSKFNCLRLGARIHNLKAAGMAICSRLVEQNGKHFAQYSIPTDSSERKLSELNARDRYEMTDRLMQGLKTGALILAVAFSTSCTTLKPGCRYQQRAVRMAQLERQYEHSRPANKDAMRAWRNWWERPQKMTRIPLTQIYFP
jgi:hypothetical protein